MPEVGRSPPQAYPHLLEDGRDLIEYSIESGLIIRPWIDKITALPSMLKERYELTGFVLVDQLRAVASTAGSCTRTGDIARHGTDGSVPAFDGIRGRQDTG